MHMVGLGPTLSQLVWILPWGNRAWTLQEALQSPRCIYISRYQVQFECNAMTCYESLDESSSFIHQTRRGKTFFGKENWHQKINTGILRSPFTTNMGLENNGSRLYSIYATLFFYRALTRQSDALSAFSGIIQALETFVYKNGFHWGLPLDDLNWALAWDGRHLARKRQGFPTWSWLSWRNAIWPGQPDPDEPQYPHQYPFDLTICKLSSEGDLVQIFKSSCDQMTAECQQQFLDDPITHADDLSGSLDSLSLRASDLAQMDH